MSETRSRPDKDRFYPHSDPMPDVELSVLHAAIRFAEQAHRGQKRKGTEVDYIIHPMEVLQILTSMNAGPELQIAGVLHDTVEDTDVTLEDIEATFGGKVANLVGNHSENKSKSWKERKQHTIDELKEADRDTKLLILADKVSNLRSMLADFLTAGESFWDRFNAPKELQSWYNSEVQDALYDLQFDADIQQVYWEFVALYKDLFVEFRVDDTSHTLYQIPCGLPVHRFLPGICWEVFEGEVPETSAPISRLEAEQIEDTWNWEARDRTLDGNDRIETAIEHYYADSSQEHLDILLSVIRDRIREDGHFIVPVDILTEPDEHGEEQDRYLPRTLTLENSEVAMAAFTSPETWNRAPKTSALSHFIDSILEMTQQGHEIAGLMLNPWGQSLFLSRELIDQLLSKPSSD